MWSLHRHNEEFDSSEEAQLIKKEGGEKLDLPDILIFLADHINYIGKKIWI